MQQAVDLHLHGKRPALEQLDALQRLRLRLVTLRIAVVQFQVGQQVHQLVYDVRIGFRHGELKGEQVLLVVLVDLHGLIHEVDVVVLKHAVAMVAVAHQCRNEVQVARGEVMHLAIEGHLAASLGHPIDT